MYILYIIVLKIKLITNLHALSVAIHVHSNRVRFWWVAELNIMFRFSLGVSNLDIRQHDVSISLSMPYLGQWRINHGADGARARGPRPDGPPTPAETNFFSGLVEMLQFVAFPKGIDRTTPSNQATRCFAERVSF